MRQCGYKVIIGDETIDKAMNDFRYEANRELVLNWLRENRINRIGISYRLDQDEAVKMMGYFMHELESNGMLHYQEAPLEGYSMEGFLKDAENRKGA